MYHLILADIKNEEPGKRKTAVTLCLSDDPGKIEVVLKMLSGLMQCVTEDKQEEVTNAFVDLTMHYRVHTYLAALEAGRGGFTQPLPDEPSMHFMLNAVDRFVTETPDNFVRWLRIEARKPMPGVLRLVQAW